MKIIAFLDGSAAAPQRAAVVRVLESHGFVPSSVHPELASLGVLSGQLPDPAFDALQTELAAGRIPGLATLTADGSQSIPRST